MDLFMPYLHNGESLPLSHLPVVEIELFRETVLSQIEEGGHLSALFVAPRNGRFLLFALISVPDREQVGVLATEVEESYWGLTPYCAQAHWFEREICEQWSIQPKGHPWLKPIRFSPSRRGGRKAATRRCMKWRWAPCTRASSNRDTSAFNATVKPSTTWKFRSGTSIAAWNGP